MCLHVLCISMTISNKAWFTDFYGYPIKINKQFLQALTSPRSVWAQGTFVSGWTIATLTSGSIFPPSTRHMECGAPLSRTTTRSILRARWSTYTLDTSGCWWPWMIHQMNATHVSWDTQHMYHETRNTCIVRYATHVSWDTQHMYHETRNTCIM